MMKLPVLWMLLALAPLRGPAAPLAAERIPTIPKPAADYLLNCGGCHGTDGVSNSKLVPDLRNQIGYYLRLREGREYLVRLPNVAFSMLSDAELADVLNFLVFRMGGASVAEGAAPFRAGEVARLRRRPLNEVSLTEYRTRLIDELIAHHRASARLRVYGSDRY
jgi:mono/diheme cytochrome c family protein